MAIKDNILKIPKYVGEGAEAVAKKSEEIIEVSKLNIAISSEQNMIKEIYEKIGRKIYKKYRENKTIDKELIEKCEQISEIEKDIEDIKKKILKIKSRKQCKYCDCSMEKSAAFCPKCGKEQ